MKRLAGIALLAVSLTACGGNGNVTTGSGSAPSPAPAAAETNEAFVKVQEMFTANKCISCHGVDLAGRAGPKTNLQKIGASKSKDDIINQIKNGGGGMPAYKSRLSDEEIGLLADWLSSKK